MKSPKSKVKYYIVTRFNLYKESYWAGAGINDGSYIEWCRHRVKLFETVALPSICAQSYMEFEWLILFDTEQNNVIADFLKRLAEFSFIVPMFMNLRGPDISTMRRQLATSVKARLAGDYTHVAMTRLDSDDAIHTEFMRLLRRRIRSLLSSPANGGDGDIVRIIFPYCALYDGKRMFVCVLPRNHFPTTLEKVDEASPLRTAFFTKHSSRHDNDVHILTSTPATLTLVHGWNVWNGEHESALALEGAEAVLPTFGLPAEGFAISAADKPPAPAGQPIVDPG